MQYDGTNRMAYDGEGRLCAVFNSLSGHVTQYIYNAEGQRVAKGHPSNGSTTVACVTSMSNFTADASYILGQSGEQMMEFDGNGGWKHTNIYGDGRVIATYDGNVTHFPFSDPLGTKRIQASYDGQVELTCSSLPFRDGTDCSIPAGAPSSADNADEHRYTGQLRDSESGLDYFGARYYASTMGRFMSPDPSGNSVASLATIVEHIQLCV